MYLDDLLNGLREKLAKRGVTFEAGDWMYVVVMMINAYDRGFKDGEQVTMAMWHCAIEKEEDNE